MGNFDIGNNPPAAKDDDPIPFDENDSAGYPGISHSPLDLGNGSSVNIPKAEEPVARIQKAPQVGDVQMIPAQSLPSGRITGTKTFFAKLHVGAIEFLDDQIADWLRKNPGITIKMTNMCVGEIQAKKTEPNLLITVWY